MSELTAMSACETVDLLKKDQVSPLELLDALESRIAEVDPVVNALPTLCFGRARAHAERLMERPAGERGRLCGLPVPIKDLTEVAGVRTTFGSRVFADHVPDASDILVENLEGEGGIVYAKSATPEFGAGANTFNEVFGTTLNPWDTSRSCAGSSGGAAVALATGLAWVAHGSDLGGSLRNPASFCGIVGMRPSPGRVAHTPGAIADDITSVQGPMARTVADLALLLGAMAGENPRDPLSLPRDGSDYLAAAHSKPALKRVAFSADLGITPVDPEVAEICRKAAGRFAEAGIAVEEAHPDFSGVHETFHTLRALGFAANHGPKLKAGRDLMKPDVVWNIEKGLKLSIDEVMKAEAARGLYIRRMNAFFDEYDLLLSPATIVAPYASTERYVKSCNGVEFDNYVDWLAIAFAVTLTTAPALSLPCGFTRSGLPVGLQMVARPRGEAHLISSAAMLEEMLEIGSGRPINPRGPAGRPAA